MYDPSKTGCVISGCVCIIYVVFISIANLLIISRRYRREMRANSVAQQNQRKKHSHKCDVDSFVVHCGK